MKTFGNASSYESLCWLYLGLNSTLRTRKVKMEVLSTVEHKYLVVDVCYLLHKHQIHVSALVIKHIQKYILYKIYFVKIYWGIYFSFVLRQPLVGISATTLLTIFIQKTKAVIFGMRLIYGGGGFGWRYEISCVLSREREVYGFCSANLSII